MKKTKLLLTMAFAAVGFVAQAQVDFNDPRFAKWGPDAETREANMNKSSFLTEALDNRDYGAASAYYTELVASCPEASEAVMARGVVLYRAKIARAKSVAEKKQMVDSLMIAHDLRLEYFSDHEKRGKDYILDSKARDYYNYMKSDREGLRNVFKATIEACGDRADPPLVLLYFQNLCEDYKMDEVMADEVMSEYDRLSPFFDKLESEYTKFRDDFTTAFSVSGAATCENLETIFGAKLEADPNNVELLAKTVKLMSRMRCNSPFYVATTEKLYELEPSSQSAMALAAIFQSQGDYDKASKYLRDAVAEETDMDAREALYARIALIQMAANNMSEAAAAARESINTPDDTKSDNGIAYFVLAQCYASSAASCSGFDGQAAFWIAYDTMALALANFTSEESDYKSIAQQSMNAYAGNFPSQEECFFNEIKDGDSYTVKCGMASGQRTTVRVRK
ncbi:MAG: tetratricopeptide repeat protein [Rikenellaceae bacterium]